MDPWKKFMPGEKAKVTMPNGEVIEGDLYQVEFHSGYKDEVYVDFAIMTDDGKVIDASLTYEEAKSGALPAAKSISFAQMPYMGLDTGAFASGAPFASEATSGQQPTPDLSQIAADLEALKAKEPKLEPVHHGHGGSPLKAFVAELYGVPPHLMPPEKPLEDKLKDLVMQIGKELQAASPEELGEFLKHGTLGLNIPLYPLPKDFSAAIKLNDPYPTIKVLHVKLEVSE